MLQKDFRKFFLKEILDFLLLQWSSLGVLGHGRSEDEWIIDPEALLVFSLDIARYEPRLFDEILDWLMTNGQWVDIQRLRGIIKTKNDKTQRIMSAVAQILSQNTNSYKRKWKALASFKKVNPGIQRETLFKTKDGKPYPVVGEQEPIFREYGFIRSKFRPSRKTREVNFKTDSTVHFLLRSLFGIGSRPECILYLLTHEAGHPAEVSRAVGISVRAVQDALVELSKSNLVLTRMVGKRKIQYWLSHKKWWQFLLEIDTEEMKSPVWLDWISLFTALMNVWKVLNEIKEIESDYMRSSKLREAMETISLEFSKSGIDLPPVPDRDVSPDRYENEFQNFIKKVLRSENDTSK